MRITGLDCLTSKLQGSSRLHHATPYPSTGLQVLPSMPSFPKDDHAHNPSTWEAEVEENHSCKFQASLGYIVSLSILNTEKEEEKENAASGNCPLTSACVCTLAHAHKHTHTHSFCNARKCHSPASSQPGMLRWHQSAPSLGQRFPGSHEPPPVQGMLASSRAENVPHLLPVLCRLETDRGAQGAGGDVTPRGPAVP